MLDISLEKELVLIGGGHAHAIALKRWGMGPLRDIRITLISDGSETAYSGMLPGHIAGFYTREECHIDLQRLAKFAGAQFYRDRVIGLDLTQQRVICAHRPPVAFDLLSLDIGSTPTIPRDIDPATIIPAKPVAVFLQAWHAFLDQIPPDRPVTIAIVGGGAGGVELALTMSHRLQCLRASDPLSAIHDTIHLFHRDGVLVPKFNSWVRRHLTQVLQNRGVQIHLNESVKSTDKKTIVCVSGLKLPCDAIIWVTQASSPEWIQKSGLLVDDHGFVLIDKTLRSRSHPMIFAAGDIATISESPRPKAGVFAVRQGKPLIENIRRTLLNRPLQSYRPQQHYLSLIGTGDGLAIAAWGNLGAQSQWLWTWKDWIDRRFMDQFQTFPLMNATPKATLPSTAESVLPMFCSGCGAKVGRTTLDRVFARIYDHESQIPQDDAAIIDWPSDQPLIQTVDYFPALIDDPFLFGQISSHHALSDLFAMGATPHSALAIATLPHASPHLTEETLFQLLSGALKVLQQAGATLVGGHTTEGSQLVFGLSCNGTASSDRRFSKSGLRHHQALILTQPLGTGVLFAAHAQLKARHDWIDGAIDRMCQSNQAAMRCLLDGGATACTDVTGFGLLGHLLEMIRASNRQNRDKLGARVRLSTIPLLDGALSVANLGIRSSLYSQNAQALQWVVDRHLMMEHPVTALLLDPQTSGGLLASVPDDQADRTLRALRAIGYDAQQIGWTTEVDSLELPILLES